MRHTSYNNILRKDYPKWLGWNILDVNDVLNIHDKNELLDILEENLNIVIRLKQLY